MRFIKKLFAFILTINILFSMNLHYALADITGDEVGNAVREKLMESFRGETGADSQATKNSVQSLNVSRQKKEPPQVALTFTPTNPVPGESVTASAVATYFMNDPNFHYYTWYLQHNTGKGEGTDSEGRKTKNGNTDWNKDGTIDIEDYKVEAMRLIANGGFDWQRAMGPDAPLCKDASVTADQKPEYCDPALFTNQYSSSEQDSDADGYEAVPGGDDQRATPAKPYHQYLHNFSSGDEFEFSNCAGDSDTTSWNNGSNKCNHLFPVAPGETTGDSNKKFTLKEEEFWHTDPKNKDTAGTGTTDEANVAGLGKYILKWNYATGDKVGVVVEGISVESTPYKDSSYMTMWALLKSMCTADPKTTDRPQDETVVAADPVYVLTNPLETTPVLDSVTGLPKTDSITGEPIMVNVYYKSVDETIYTHTYTDGPYVVTNTTGSGPSELVTTKVTTQTKHYKEDKTKVFAESLDGSGYTYATTPYETVNRTEHPDLTTVAQTGTVFKARTSVQDINDCLMDNIMEPSEGAADQKMEVNLSFSPNAPVNSDASDVADQLTIQSSVVGAANKEFLSYAWQIYLSSDIAAEESQWHLLTLPETGLKKLSGIGLESLQMKLNFSEDFLREARALVGTDQKIFYAKAVLRAVDSQDKKKKEGTGTVIIPIQLSSGSLKVFSTTVAENLDLALDTTAERCKEGLDAVTCPVAKNEIIGARFNLSAADLNDYEFFWSFDNEPITETAKNIAYFPILGERNTQHTLSLNVSNTVTGEKMTLIKNFKVIDPAIKIQSLNDTCAPTLLGYYIDPININPNPDPGTDSSQWPDISEDKFEALPAATIKLKPLSTPAFDEKSAWFFDGVQVTTANMASLGVTDFQNSDNILEFVATKPAGQKYNITFSALYTQPGLVKKALNSKWDVAQTSFYEKSVSKSIEIQMTEVLSSSGVALQKTPQQKIMASLFSAIPSYINFLFRVILTMGLILFLTRALFSLFPKQNQV